MFQNTISPKKGERHSTLKVKCATSLALFFAALLSRYIAVDLRLSERKIGQMN